LLPRRLLRITAIFLLLFFKMFSLATIRRIMHFNNSCGHYYKAFEEREKSLLLIIAFELHGDGFAQHNNRATLHEGHTTQAFASVERGAHKRLERLKHNFSHFIRLQEWRILGLRALGLLANLPVDVAHLACRAASTDKGDWRVAFLKFSGMVEDLNLRGEVLAGLERVVGGQNHTVSNTGHVLLLQVLDVQAHVVSRSSKRTGCVVHLNGEHLASAVLGLGVGGDEHDNVVGADFLARHGQ